MRSDSKFLVCCLGAMAFLYVGCVPSGDPATYGAGGGEPGPTLSDEDDSAPALADFGALDAPQVPDSDPIEGDDDDEPVEGDDDDEPVEGDDDDDEPVEGEEDVEPDPVEEPAPPTCEDDNFENNDSPDEAALVLEGPYNVMVACDANPDWYTIPVLTGDVLEVDLAFDSAAGDISLELYDPAGALVASSVTSGDSESISFEVTTNGEWFIHAYLDAGANAVLGNGYAMEVNVIDVECLTDPYEPNDSDLAPWPMPSGSWTDLQVCPYGDDFFAVWLEPGEELIAEVAFATGDGDLDLTLLDPTGLPLAWSSSAEEVETTTTVAASTGWHVIWVELTLDEDEAVGTTYDLTLVAP